MRPVRVRLIDAKGALWFTDFVYAYWATSMEIVTHYKNLGWLDNDWDANGNAIPQGVPDEAFDALTTLGPVP
jgi:hypothetical protein